MDELSTQKWSEVILESLTEIDDTTEKKFRAWFITINNYTSDEVETLKKEGRDEHCKYLVFQFEVGHECGTPHLHAFIYYKNPRVWPKKKFPRADIRVPMNNDNVIRYCTKSATRWDGPWEFGTRPKQGDRSDLEDLKDNIASGAMTVDQIVMTEPAKYHQYGRTLERIESIKNRDKFRNFMTDGEWVRGEPGNGKSEYAFQGYTPQTHFVVNMRDGGYWDNYTGQETVIFEDLKTPYELPWGELLTLVDCRPKTVKIKYKSPVPFLAKKVIITSVLTPAEVYGEYINGSSNDNLVQFNRRFSEIVVTDWIATRVREKQVVVRRPSAPTPRIEDGAQTSGGRL